MPQVIKYRQDRGNIQLCESEKSIANTVGFFLYSTARRACVPLLTVVESESCFYEAAVCIFHMYENACTGLSMCVDFVSYCMFRTSVFRHFITSRLKCCDIQCVNSCSCDV